MNKEGQWRLSPAFDVTYAHNPVGKWSNQHQMSLDAKRDDFTWEDLEILGRSISLKKPGEIIVEVTNAVAQWDTFARQAGLKSSRIREVGDQHRKIN